MTSMRNLINAVARRNRAAAKVAKLEDALYEARNALESTERAVRLHHQKAPYGTQIAYSQTEWAVVEP